MLKPVKSIIAAVVAVIVLIGGGIAFFASTSINTEPDQVGLWYKAGPISSTEFDHCVNPGTKELFKGIADKTFLYPAGQRTYSFGVASGQVDTASIKVLTKDSIELDVTGVIRYKLNMNCETLQEFHEEIGLKFEADMEDGTTSEGWVRMLNVYLGESLKRAMDEATKDYDWKRIYNDPDTKVEWEQKIREYLPRFVKQAMGGEYFTDYALTVQKPTLPEKLKKALQETQVAVEQNNAQKRRNETVKTELQSIEELVDILGVEGYNTYQAIKDGRMPVYTIPEGSGVVVDGKGGK